MPRSDQQEALLKYSPVVWLQLMWVSYHAAAAQHPAKEVQVSFLQMSIISSPNMASADAAYAISGNRWPGAQVEQPAATAAQKR